VSGPHARSGDPGRKSGMGDLTRVAKRSRPGR
ncbi:hypothetical protein AZ037_003793, partial [Klebsiella michiganensis]